MPHAHLRLYLHIVFGTWKRQPLIRSEIEEKLYTMIATKCRELDCWPLAINGTGDHIHVLARLPNTISIAQLVKEIKGFSSHFIANRLLPEEFFKWQVGYGAFTLRESDIPVVERYILHQKEHHTAGTLQKDWEVPS